MEGFLFYLLKASIGITVFYLAYFILFRNEKNFRFNRIYLLSAMIISFIIPLIRFSIKVPAPETLSIFNLEIQEVSATEISKPIPGSFQLYKLIFSLYITVSILFLIHFLTGIIKAFFIVKKSQKKEIHSTRILVSDQEIHPFSFFNKIIIPKDSLSSPNLGLIIKHEKIHADKKHTLDMLLTEFIFLLQWFNPFAWNLRQAIKTNLEYLTDEEITKNSDIKTYQTAMVSLANKKEVTPFLNALNGSQLKKRIIMMNTKTKNKFISLKQWLVAPILLFLTLALSGREISYYSSPDDNIVINGKVTNQNTGQGIPGATVIVKEFTTGTVTTEDGSYSLKLDGTDYTLLFITPDGKNRKEIRIGENREINMELEYNGESSSIQIRDIEPGSERSETIRVIGFGPSTDDALYIINGEKTDKSVIEDLDPNTIESIQVLKGEITEVYGDEAENGVIIISIAKDSDFPTSDNILIRGQSGINSEDLLYIIDGEKTDKSVMENLDPNTIESIQVLKGEEAEIYGEEGKDGVILINLKK